MFQQGDRIGSYTLVHQIGRGGFGEVWLAEKSGIVTIRFALKLPRDVDIDSAIFKQEASVWVQASGHTNIVPIIEADAYSVKRDGIVLKSDQIVIVSEYLRDGSLEKQLQKYKNNNLPTETVLEIALGILAGLKYLHTRQPPIIHRDLKPDNILLQGETPRLTDFGIARMLKTNSYSRTEHISGTLPYMAPEVFKGHYSVSTDVWAAGVILYQLLSGRLPFPQPEIAALIWAIANDDPEPLPTTVPDHFRTIAYKALKKNPVERYKSAAEMRKALVDAKQGHGHWDSTIPAPSPHPVPTKDFDYKKEPEPPVPKPLPRSLWVIAAFVVLLSVFAFSFYISRKPGATAFVTPSDKNAQPAITANTPSANSQTEGNSASETPNLNAGPVAATGIVEFETGEEPLSAPQSGKIIEWLVKPGDFVNQIYKPIANYSYEREVPARVGDPNSYYVSSVDHLDIWKPSIVKSISVRAGQEFTPGQELCRVGTVLHVWVRVKLAPYDLARVPIGSNAFFKTNSNIVFKGRVESVNVQEGVAKIKLLDEHVFNTSGLLTLGPDARGEVTFDAGTAAK